MSQKDPAASWKRGLLVFGMLFLVSCTVCVLMVTVNGASAGGPPQFMGMKNYLRLWLKDDLLLKALWNTIRWRLAAAVAAAAALTAVRWVMSRKGNAMLWSGLTYALTGIGVAALFGGLLIALFGYPSFLYASSTLVLHSFSPFSVMQYHLYYIGIISPFAVLMTFLIWCLDHAAAHILLTIKKNNKRNENHG